MPAIRLRDATASDLALAFEIAEDAMRAATEAAWGHWDVAEQRRRHVAGFKPETHQLILADDAVAGLLAVEQFATYAWLVKLYLLGPYRGLGIGSAVLTRLLHDAHAQGKPVTLEVLRVNQRAQALYARHGFTVTAEHGKHLYMSSSA